MSAAAEHDEHSSFIKTPQQLITVVVLAFLIPIIGILLLITLVMGGKSPDPRALEPDAVAARIQPVGKVELGAGGAAAAGPRAPEELVKSACLACHAAGVAGAPKLGDKAAWAPRIKTGAEAMLKTLLAGKGAMPPKGGAAGASDYELARAVVYMANQSGGALKEPAAPKGAAAPAAAAPATATTTAGAAVDGKKVYEGACVACHASGVANAPKFGDKAAWGPRIKTGTEAMVKTVMTGKGAMPPKGGNAALTDAEIKAAVEYMVAAAK
ncbi:MAG: cytochrome c5 family protein [Betaproteobacteria bacterium]|nr:cytochrome c5 family protein [Betaproteobacteria bacterium]